jgi:glycosyltransferase involved in cell wall biosynthesis
MKKIVCIHLLNDYSGSPLVLSEVINGLLENNYSVDLYTSRTKGFLSIDEINIFNVFYKRSNKKIIVFLYYILSQFLLFFKLLKYKNENVIFYINTMLPFGAGLAGKILNKQVIYHIHETSIKPNLLKKYLLKIISLTSSKNIFVSNFLEKEEYIDNIDSFVVYNSLPKKFSRQSYKHKYTYDSNFNVLMICSLKKYKGILQFIDISKKILKNNRIKFFLVLNASKNEINNYFSNLDIPSNVSIYSSQNNIHPFYKNATLVINLSRIDEWVETFGMTLLEAMSYGIPCIAPPNGGPLELIDDNINGYLISSYDIHKITNLINHLEHNRYKLEILSKNARKKSLQFNRSIFIKSILDIINDKKHDN